MASIISIALLIGLFLIDWNVAISVASIFLILYCLIAVTARRELRLNSRLISEYSVKQLKSLNEGIGAIRDVLLDSSQQTYIEIYRSCDLPQRNLQARNYFLTSFPDMH